MICPGPAVRVGREAAMLDGIVFEDMATMDFCQLVVDELKRAAIRWQDPNIIQAGPEGCGVVLVLMYLDCCLLKAVSVMHVQTPRANFLTEKVLNSIFLKDIVKKGGKILDGYVFGKLGQVPLGKVVIALFLMHMSLPARQNNMHRMRLVVARMQM